MPLANPCPEFLAELVERFKILAELEPSLDTIQLLGVDPNNTTTVKWFLVSHSLAEYKDAIQHFTEHDDEKHSVRMTLADEAWLESWYWYEEWHQVTSQAQKCDGPPLREEFDFGKIEKVTAVPTPTVAQRVVIWKDCLANWDLAGAVFRNRNA